MENTENKMTAEQIFHSKSTAELKQEAIAAVHAWNPNIQLTEEDEFSAHFLVENKFTLEIGVDDGYLYELYGDKSTGFTGTGNAEVFDLTTSKASEAKWENLSESAAVLRCGPYIYEVDQMVKDIKDFLNYYNI